MLDRLETTRIVADPAALDGVAWPGDAVVMRIADDDVIMIGCGQVVVDDPHAIIVEDAGWCGIWVSRDEATQFLEHSCEWELPTERPVFVQGMVAHLAVKMWLEPERALFVVPQTLAMEFAERAPTAWTDST